ncbi:MAG TPA: hypothetical protein VMJ66_01325 [Geobacteraceae bacterium]|nr:hypothetical protein [Geobacteraceae bacterium]
MNAVLALPARIATGAIVMVCLAGCAGMPFAGRNGGAPDTRTTQDVAGETAWREHKGWLLARLPEAVRLAQDVSSALKEYPDKDPCSPNGPGAGCAKLMDFLTRKSVPYELRRITDGTGLGSVVLVDADKAYIFRLTDRTFSGIADISHSLYFAAEDVPLLRTDGRSFAFVVDDRTDQTTVWTLYRGDAVRNDGALLPLGEFTLARAELDAAGVPRQIDLLTPQERGERDLAKQGIVWRNRAQMKATRICSENQEKQKPRSAFGFGGKRKHDHVAAQEGAAADSTITSATTMTDALAGKARLNCSAGSGYVVTEDGVVGEVAGIARNGVDADAVISSTAREVPGGVIRYRYTVGQGSTDSVNPAAGKDMELQVETTKEGNRLTLVLRPEVGAITGSLLLPGDWYVGPGYRIRGRDVSNTELAALFLRAYRDCAVKDDRGVCKGIPDLFMSFLNPQNEKEFMQYVADHYLELIRK